MSGDTMPAPPNLPENLAVSFCSHEPPTMFSEGLWGSNLMSALHHPMPVLELHLVAVFVFHYLLHPLHTRFRVPWVVIHGLVGMLLGHFLRQNPRISQHVLNDESEAVIRTITSVGYAMFMFLTGVKMDPGMILKLGKQAWLMGCLSLLFPIMLCAPFTRVYLTGKDSAEETALNFFSFTQSLTPFPVIACLLTDLKILNSELGRLASSAALICNLMSTAFFMMFIILSLFNFTSPLVGLKTLLVSSIFLFVVMVLARPLMRWIIKRTPEGKPVKEFYIILLICLAIWTAVLSDFVGLEYMYGPLMFGLAVPDGPPLGSTLAERLDTFISGMVVPLFMTYGGYRINLHTQLEPELIFCLSGVIILSLLGRIAAGFVTSKWCKLPLKDCLVLAIIMSAKGICELSLYITCNDKKQMNNTFLSMAIISVLLTALVVPFVVRSLHDPSRKYTGYQKRSIMHAEKNTELKMVVCVLRQDDALASINLLEAFNPSMENPLALYVLNLIELVGRATPLLIDHQLGQKVSKHSTSNGLRTQHTIDLFYNYMCQNAKSVNVQVFTSVSSCMFMHDDISDLAFGKMASFIVLPFHRKWSNKGKVVLDDVSLRSINCGVLNKSPCSVGILVDRRKMAESSFDSPPATCFRIAVLFIGGDDDREALVLGKRMLRGSQVHLTVVRLVSPDVCDDQWEMMLDAETLKDVKVRSLENGNVTYCEETVRDGPQTASLVRAMENEFELVIVGQHHRADCPFLSGLSEWSEFPELGPVGDLLASSDVQSPVSAMVVQHQRCD